MTKNEMGDKRKDIPFPIYWISSVIALIAGYFILLSLSAFNSSMGLEGLGIIIIFPLGVSLFFVAHSLLHGKNWARIFWLVLFIVYLPLIPMILLSIKELSLKSLSFTMGMILAIVSIYYLFFDKKVTQYFKH